MIIIFFQRACCKTGYLLSSRDIVERKTQFLPPGADSLAGKTRVKQVIISAREEAVQLRG